MTDLTEVAGIEFCAIHHGVMTEGTDYHPDGLGCEYPENDRPDKRCVGVPLYWKAPEDVTP